MTLQRPEESVAASRTQRLSFGSFNARALPPKSVAESFIVPPHFRTLAHGAHTVIVGPRGSGKTTLLKMLTAEGLIRADELGKLQDIVVPFTGIFIPTDISWSRQLDSYEQMGLSSNEAKALQHAAFVTAVFRATIDAISFRCSLLREGPGGSSSPIDMPSSLEQQFVNGLSELWDCDPRLPSIFGLRVALGQRLIEIGRFAAREKRLGEARRQERFANLSGLDIPLVGGLSGAFDLLEALVPTTSGDRWALLFDELELAPADVRGELLAALRSVDDRILFKLSISPYNEEVDRFASVLGAMEGHDHEVINLTYARSDDSLDFAKELMQAVALSRGFGHRRIEDLLPGRTSEAIDAVGADVSLATKTRSATRRYEPVFRRLYVTDQTFRDYLDGVAGGLEAALSSSGDDRAKNVRKIGPLVEARVELRQPDGTLNRRYKTRRSTQLYVGVHALAIAYEGNPRWIISSMNSMLDELQANPDWGCCVPAIAQAREIGRSANRFRALLATMPVPAIPGFSRRGLLPLIDRLGDFVRDRVVADAFNPDPVGSFTVDALTPEPITRALGVALNTGAMVYVPDGDDQALLSSLRGKRLRLSYLLATDFGLPLRLERPVALSRALPRRAKDAPPSLFDEEG